MISCVFQNAINEDKFIFLIYKHYVLCPFISCVSNKNEGHSKQVWKKTIMVADDIT